ncbi:unnamed protein product [Linum trigynum]|uniref:Uncharacterized protein n=1 Tax=Linum trigynum TaxID=586398 RepID=A0AAV2FIZ9_9ROSI
MALWHREEAEFWLDPSYPRISTQDALDEAWRLMGEEEEEQEQERKSIVHVKVDSNSSSNPSILSKSKSKGSKIRSGLQKVVSSILRLGRSKKSSSKPASSSSGSSSSPADQSNESLTGPDSPRHGLANHTATCLDDVVQKETQRLVRDSAASASASSSSTNTSDSSTGESSFEADSSSSSIMAADFLALEKTQGDGATVVSPPRPDLVIIETVELILPVVSEKTVAPAVGDVEQPMPPLAGFAKKKKKKRKEPKRRRSTTLPIALCFPVLWV